LKAEAVAPDRSPNCPHGERKVIVFGDRSGVAFECRLNRLIWRIKSEGGCASLAGPKAVSQGLWHSNGKIHHAGKKREPLPPPGCTVISVLVGVWTKAAAGLTNCSSLRRAEIARGLRAARALKSLSNLKIALRYSDFRKPRLTYAPAVENTDHDRH
jgi:hypothetical protein